MLKVMIDTNIFISGLFFSGNPRKVLIQALDDKICLILSEDVIDETERVISKKFGSLVIRVASVSQMNCVGVILSA